MEKHYTAQVTTYGNVIDRMQMEITQLTEQNTSLARENESLKTILKRTAWLENEKSQKKKVLHMSTGCVFENPFDRTHKRTHKHTKPTKEKAPVPFSDDESGSERTSHRTRARSGSTNTTPTTTSTMTTPRTHTQTHTKTRDRSRTVANSQPSQELSLSELENELPSMTSHSPPSPTYPNPIHPTPPHSPLPSQMTLMSQPMLANAHVIHQVFLVSFEILSAYSKAFGLLESGKHSSTVTPSLPIRKLLRKSKDISCVSNLPFIYLMQKMRSVSQCPGNICDQFSIPEHLIRPMTVALEDAETTIGEAYNARTFQYTKVFKNAKWYPYPLWALCGLFFVFRLIQPIHCFLKTHLCTAHTCPEMTAGPNIVYRYKDTHSLRTVSACEYFELVTKFLSALPTAVRWDKLILSHAVNPLPLPLIADMQAGVKMLLRYINHIYYSHGGSFLLNEEHRSLKKMAEHGLSSSVLVLE